MTRTRGRRLTRTGLALTATSALLAALILYAAAQPAPASACLGAAAATAVLTWLASPAQPRHVGRRDRRARPQRPTGGGRLRITNTFPCGCEWHHESGPQSDQWVPCRQHADPASVQLEEAQ